MLRPVHFEIHAADPVAAIAFYEGLFDWRFTAWDGPMDYWTIATGPDGAGLGGGLMRRRGPDPEAGAPVMGATLVVGVGDVRRQMARAVELGGSEALAVQRVPGVGDLGYVKDPAGNVIGMLQPLNDA